MHGKSSVPDTFASDTFASPTAVFGAKETTHNRISADLGLPDDPATRALFEFLGKALKK